MLILLSVLGVGGGLLAGLSFLSDIKLCNNAPLLLHLTCRESYFPRDSLTLFVRERSVSVWLLQFEMFAEKMQIEEWTLSCLFRYVFVGNKSAFVFCFTAIADGLNITS